MEHLHEINKIIGELELSEQLKISLGLICFDRNSALMLGYQEGWDYTFKDIKNFIGEDAFESHLKTFENLLLSELIKIKNDLNFELQSYNITKE